MTQNQFEAILRVLLAAGGPVAGLLVSWGVAPGNVNNLLTVALIVLPPLASAIWTYLAHTDAKTAVAASKVPGVEVTADGNAASAAVMAVAMDPTNPVKVASP